MLLVLIMTLLLFVTNDYAKVGTYLPDVLLQLIS